jgi:hypothetical protein
MILNPDNLASIFCAAMAYALFSLDVHTDPKLPGWVSAPRWVRWPVRSSGALLVLRAADLWTLAKDPIPLPGHINYLGLAVSASLAISFVTVAIYINRGFLKNRGWERTRHVVEVQKANPEMVPVMMNSEDAAVFGVVGPTPTDMLATLQRADDHLAEGQHP